MKKALLPMLVCGILCAQEKPERNPIEELVDQARAASPEVFSDIVLRLVENDRLEEGRTPDLLEEVFRRAAQAREPYPVRYALAGTAVDRDEMRSAGRRHRLDALSLRCRALLLLLDVDPRRAKKLFDEMPAPDAPAATCRDAFVTDASLRWELISMLARAPVFTEEELHKQEPLRIVEASLRTIRDPGELVPAAGMVSSLAQEGFDVHVLASALAAALDAVNGSYRAFAAAVTQESLVPRAMEAARQLQKKGADATAVASALRGFLVRHLNGVRCSDSDNSGGALDAFAVEARAMGLGDIAALAPEVPDDGERGGMPVRGVYSNSEDFLRLERALGALGKPAGGVNTTGQMRQTTNWNYAARELATLIERWTGADKQSRAEVAYQRSLLWYRLFDIAPAGEISRLAMGGYLDALAEEEFQREAPGAWREQVERLLLTAHLFRPAMTGELRKMIPDLPFESGMEVPQAMMASRSAAVALYGRLAVVEAKR